MSTPLPGSPHESDHLDTKLVDDRHVVERDESFQSILWSPYVANILIGKTVESVHPGRPNVAAGERLAFPHPNSVKRAALIVDRIYMPSWADADLIGGLPLEITFGDSLVDQQFLASAWQYLEVFWPWKIEDPKEKVEEFLNIYLKEPLARYGAAFPEATFLPINYSVGSPVLPIGQHLVYQGVLNNIPVVIEDCLAWEQVIEFRKDEEVRRKYRDLHLWLAQGLKGESVQQVTDEIGQKLDDYRWAIKKHGMKTAIEAVSTLVSLSAVLPAAGGLTAAAMLLGPLSGALIGGVVAVAGATAWIAKRQVDLQDLKRGKDREVAYLYEIQESTR